MKLLSAISADPRWASVVARDAASRFFYSVRTTGVYCRPSCGARLPRPANVQFHATRQEAEAAGFRPCKRCRPDLEITPIGETVARICRWIEESDTLPGLAELAARAGMSQHHFHRTFKKFTGLTPRAYAAGQRARRVKAALTAVDSVTEAIYDAGYQSNARFYEESKQILGMKPSNYKAGGAQTSIRFAVGECALGSILVASSRLGVCAIFLGDNPESLAQELQGRFPRADIEGGDADFEALIARVIEFVETPASGLDLPLDIRGTIFQQRVWRALRDIPPGTTASYTDVARAIGSPASVRAVAAACAANTLAVAIPCHRVVRQDGALSGYRWGTERKRALLDREATS